MSEEEKQAIERIKEDLKEAEKSNYMYADISIYDLYSILNLIEKQQKEIEDKNQFIDELQFRYNIEHQSKIERYISKDKIREDIKKFEKLQEQTESVLQDIRYTRADLIKYLKELLKEGE